MKRFMFLSVLMLILMVKCSFAQEEEVSLFDSDGNAVAYIAFDGDAPTIYMWSGKPVAYLANSSGAGVSIYGFNGKHLGWFVKGVARDHDGNATCGVRQVVASPKFEPFKAFKVFEPSRPAYSSSWSSMPCGAFLFEGAR